MTQLVCDTTQFFLKALLGGRFQGSIIFQKVCEMTQLGKNAYLFWGKRPGIVDCRVAAKT